MFFEILAVENFKRQMKRTPYRQEKNKNIQVPLYINETCMCSGFSFIINYNTQQYLPKYKDTTPKDKTLDTYTSCTLKFKTPKIPSIDVCQRN